MKKEVKIGILGLLTIAILIVGGQFLKGTNIFKRSNTYHVIYDDAYGLLKSSPVLVRGMRVGIISDLEIRPDGKVLCTFTVSKDIEIPKPSYAKVASIDMLGTKGVQVELGNPSNPKYTPEDTLQNGVNLGLVDNLMAKIDPVTIKATAVLANLDTITKKINKIVGDDDGRKTKAKLDKSLDEMQVAISEMSKTLKNANDLLSINKQSINASLKNVETLTASINAKDKTINNILQNTDVATKKLSEVEMKQTVEKLNETANQLNALMAKMNDNKGTIGMLFNDKELYNKLTQTTNSVNLLLNDFRSNPKNYVHMSVFGKKAKPTPIIVSPNDTLGTRLKTDRR